MNKKNTSMKKYFRLLSLIYLISLTILLLIPLDLYLVTNIIEEKNQPNNNTSYLIHIVLFFIMYSLFNFSYSSKNKLFIFCLFYSILVEILQIYTSRGFEIADVFCNISGLLISYAFFNIFIKKSNKI